MHLFKNTRIGSSGRYRLHPPFLLGCVIFGFGLAIMIADVAELTF